MTQRILIVDDEAQIALVLAHAFRDAGFDVVGPAASVAQAMSLLEKEACDGAILDIKLRRETSEPIAAALLARNVPVIAITGHTSDQVPAFFDQFRIFTKPFKLGELVGAMRALLEIA